MLTKRLFALAAVVLISGCSLDKQTAPPLAGPSELGLALTVTATPDIITQDGQSQATIQVLARDAVGQPVSGLSLRLDTYVGQTPADYGTLSSKVTSTGNDGRATVTYRAPNAPPSSVTDDAVVAVLVTPVGVNYAASVAREVLIRLARPGVIIPPGNRPVPSFFFSPKAPREDDDVFFDGSASTGTIVSYRWSFGDGRSETLPGPTVRHVYGLAGTYNVSLTVTDDLGRSETSTPQEVQVASLADPVANFTSSPSSPRRTLDPVTFNASLSKPAAGRTIVNYTWDFGETSPVISTGDPIVQHTYAFTGTFTVVLKVTDDAGRVGTTSKTVTIVAAP